MALYVSFECESCENENCTGKGLKSTVYKCKGYKHKQTNYDLLISKSPEEFAGWLNTHFTCPPGQTCPIGKGSCEKCWLDWLRQEVGG